MFYHAVKHRNRVGFYDNHFLPIKSMDTNEENGYHGNKLQFLSLNRKFSLVYNSFRTYRSSIFQFQCIPSSTKKCLNNLFLETFCEKGTRLKVSRRSFSSCRRTILVRTLPGLLSDIQASYLQRAQKAPLAFISLKELKKLSIFRAPSPLKKIQARAAPPNAKVGSF